MAIGALSLFVPVFVPTAALGSLYLGHRAIHFDWRTWITTFFTGPGRGSRILLLLLLLTNWKNLPFAWSFRLFHSYIYQYYIGRPALLPRALFHYSITKSRNSLLETDYNLHKSNSTYFSDLDISRSHVVGHLLWPGVPRVAARARAGHLLDRAGNPVRDGAFGIGLGAVFCSFRREIDPLRSYELWSRILAWDRKWLYIVTYFVAPGKVRPTSWDGRSKGPVRPPRAAAKTADGKPDEDDFSKYIYATALSKYVFKLGRFTVHPAILLEECGLLPERPGGWRGGEDDLGTADDLDEAGEADGSRQDGEWTWRDTERERRKGMAFAQHFAALDATSSLFDGGEDGALGRFRLG